MFKAVNLVSVLLLLSVLVVSPVANAQTSNDMVWYERAADDQPVIHLYFFWSKKCPHCLKAQPDVLAMEKELPWLKLHSLELVEHPENIKIYTDMAAMFRDDARSVPAFMFCGNMLSGYESKESTGQLLRSYLQSCYRFVVETNPDNGTAFVLDESSSTELEIPLLGSISTKDYSLPVLTVFIAGMDAFNPCAFFVLLFLLSMMVHSRSRARMALIGGIFVFFFRRHLLPVHGCLAEPVHLSR
ncbi:MAG: thioredoxin family protein [Gammaproteobacteria bacterium]|nr:thioredoxin family protein [Gammaproteobacteria bacterium]